MFEMGFEPQLRDISKHLGTDRQTLLFSATMPEQLAAFARAGLQNAEVIRLDAETKISPELQMQFLCVRKEEKEATFIIVFKDKEDNASMPNSAVGYKLNRNLKANGKKTIEYAVENLQKGDEIKSTWISYIVNPNIAKKLDIKSEDIVKPYIGMQKSIIVE